MRPSLAKLFEGHSFGAEDRAPIIDRFYARTGVDGSCHPTQGFAA
jgi:hypothetical protein